MEVKNYFFLKVCCSKKLWKNLENKVQYSLIVKIATIQTISYSLYSYACCNNNNNIYNGSCRVFRRFSELERSASTGGASLDEVSIVEVLIWLLSRLRCYACYKRSLVLILINLCRLGLHSFCSFFLKMRLLNRSRIIKWCMMHTTTQLSLIATITT